MKKKKIFIDLIEEQNAVLLVLLFKEISLCPELSSPSRFSGGSLSLTGGLAKDEGNSCV